MWMKVIEIWLTEKIFKGFEENTKFLKLFLREILNKIKIYLKIRLKIILTLKNL